MIAIIGLGTWGYFLYSERPVPQDELWGIKLGMTEQEVKYLKGEPQPGAKESDNWSYNSENKKVLYLVGFKDGVVSDIFAWGGSLYSPNLAHVSSYGGRKAVEEKLGKPTHEYMSTDSLNKMLVYDRYQVYFILEKDSIDAVGVFDPKKYTPGFGSFDTPSPSAPNQKPTSKPSTSSGLPNAKPSYDSVGWTQESTNSIVAGPWLKFSPPGTRYCRMADRTIFRLYPPGVVVPNAVKANPFFLGDSTEVPR